MVGQGFLSCLSHPATPLLKGELFVRCPDRCLAVKRVCTRTQRVATSPTLLRTTSPALRPTTRSPSTLRSKSFCCLTLVYTSTLGMTQPQSRQQPPEHLLKMSATPSPAQIPSEPAPAWIGFLTHPPPTTRKRKH